MRVLGLRLTDPPCLCCERGIYRQAINVGDVGDALHDRAIARAGGAQITTRLRQARQGHFDQLADIVVAAVVDHLAAKNVKHPGHADN